MAEEAEEGSKLNLGEVGVVETYLGILHSTGIPDSEISVITPYLRQAEKIKALVSGIEVSTVDSFQGRESTVVVISLVRSNAEKIVGFLSDYRRLNVAVTRAQKQVFIVGDSETIGSDPVLKTLFEYACDFGSVISAESFRSETLVGSSLLLPKPIGAPPKNKAAKKTPKPIPPPVVVLPPDDSFSENATQILSTLSGRFEFGSDLSAAQRREVHEIAERFGLKHGSTGEGSARFVWVEQKRIPQPPTAREIHVPKVPKPLPEKKEIKPVLVKQKLEQKTVITHATHVATKASHLCPFETCPMSTNLVSISCEFCSKAFCVKHALPEVHGCSEAISKQAKKNIKEELKKLKKPPSPIIPGKGGVSTAALRTKISTKMDKLKQSRTSQQPKG